jgi:hypothetical protein
MTHSFDRSAFEVSILNSAEDYEPYGFFSPQLAGHGAAGSTTGIDARFGGHARVIEGYLLDDFDSVGC